jgi:hypothetical protein
MVRFIGVPILATTMTRTSYRVSNKSLQATAVFTFLLFLRRASAAPELSR